MLSAADKTRLQTKVTCHFPQAEWTSPAREDAVEAFDSFVAAPEYPCVGAKAALQRSACQFGFYTSLGTADAVKSCTKDLQRFAANSDELDEEFATFIAIFAKPKSLREREYSGALWRHLSQMARLDQRHYAWDATYSSDPGSPDFAMSIGGRGFYIIGLHPLASRLARKFPYCALVFNAHSQFEKLKSKGAYKKIRDTIRDRDRLLQGETNPMVEDHGVRSEALQYDGASHPEGWRPQFNVEPSPGEAVCPFANIRRIAEDE